MFQSVMHELFGDLLYETVLVYLDDILESTKPVEEHGAHVPEVLERLRTYRLYANKEKCESYRESTRSLGFVLSSSGLSPDHKKIGALVKWKTPLVNKQKVKRFCGLASY